MKSFFLIFRVLEVTVCISSCKGQPVFNNPSLKLQKEIALNGVKGRIDHIDVNLANQIAYIAALGNNKVEVVDLKKGLVINTIKGFEEPQGLAYIPKHKVLFVANGGNGECGFYDAFTFKKIASLNLGNDADDVRYDENSSKIYVGYGEGGIAIIDAETKKVITDIKLPAHPESFQIDTKEGKIWINIPDAGMIAVADIKTGTVTAKWKKLLPRFNFPMAYDEKARRIIVGYRFPATLKVLDANTGREIFSSAMVGDADDIYWDSQTKQVFVSGGGGSINVFKQTGPDTYKLTADIKTASGARTSLLVPELSLFLLAVRENDGSPAKLQVFKLGD